MTAVAPERGYSWSCELWSAARGVDGGRVELGEEHPGARTVLLTARDASGRGVDVELDLAEARRLRDALDAELTRRGAA